MFAKVKAFCFHSLTIAWSYCLALAAALMSFVDNIGDALGDPSLKDQIGAAIGDTKIAARILLGISIVTILVRLRSLKKVV
jgi:hypothetical protein